MTHLILIPPDGDAGPRTLGTERVPNREHSRILQYHVHVLKTTNS